MNNDLKYVIYIHFNFLLNQQQLLHRIHANMTVSFLFNLHKCFINLSMCRELLQGLLKQNTGSALQISESCYSLLPLPPSHLILILFYSLCNDSSSLVCIEIEVLITAMLTGTSIYFSYNCWKTRESIVYFQDVFTGYQNIPASPHPQSHMNLYFFVRLHL